MINNTVGFPYPVLTSETGDGADYEDSAFQCMLDVKETDTTPSSAQLTYDFNLSNEAIESLINHGYAAFAIEIDCIKTITKETYYLKKEGTIELDLADYYGEVKFSPKIIVVEPYENFTSEDLNAEFGNTGFSLQVGDIIAIDDEVIKTVDYNKLSIESFAKIQLDESMEPLLYNIDIGGNFLSVRMGKKLHQIWQEADLNIRPVLCAAILKDLIFFALCNMKEGNDEGNESRWANSFKIALRDLDEPEPDGKSELVELNIQAQKLTEKFAMGKLAKNLGI